MFARHLIGEEIPDELGHRYARACELYFAKDEASGAGVGVVDFARRHPWSIGFLDAGCGIVAREHLLRRKLLCLTAILEAGTEYTRHFLPDRRGARSEVLLAGWNALLGAVKAVLGVPLFYLVGGR